MQEHFEIKITYYQDWMKPQISQMFIKEYQYQSDQFEKFFHHFYEHPFQKDKSIRIVAVSGEKIVGFQSVFYWPYEFNGRVLYTCQSGNSLVHEDFRGKGIFRKLLKELDIIAKKKNIEFFIGFPVLASLPSFKKENWLNIFNLSWHVKLLNPFTALLFSKVEGKLQSQFSTTWPTELLQKMNKNFRLHENTDFIQWRKQYSFQRKYFFSFESEGKKIIFEFKFNKRKFIKEIILGNIHSESQDLQFLEEGFQCLIKELKKLKSFTFLSFCFNEGSEDLTFFKTIRKVGFKKIKKNIFFIVKNLNSTFPIDDQSKWNLFRSDIDTW